MLKPLKSFAVIDFGILDYDAEQRLNSLLFSQVFTTYPVLICPVDDSIGNQAWKQNINR